MHGTFNSRDLVWEGAGLEGVEVRTVDGFQGREKELIILRYSKYLRAHM